jgi:hypothetical protein
LDYVLAFVGTLCCLIVPALLIGAPLTILGVSTIREKPASRLAWTLAFAIGNAVLSGILLCVAGIVWGMSVQSEGAGETLEFLMGAGCLGGSIAGFACTFLILLVVSRRGDVRKQDDR